MDKTDLMGPNADDLEKKLVRFRQHVFANGIFEIKINQSMEKTEKKKTAEEFLKKNASFEFEEWKRDCPGGYKLLMRAMKEHTAQELADYKAVIEELLPIAERYKEEFEKLSGGGFADGSHIIIERARKLIDKL